MYFGAGKCIDPSLLHPNKPIAGFSGTPGSLRMTPRKMKKAALRITAYLCVALH
jgi:hypothetical protein